MAKILHGSTIADVRGRVGAVVFQSGPFGSVLHLASRPRRSPSITSSYDRSIAGAISRAWSFTLDEAQRRAWRAFAAGHPVPSRSGPVRVLPAATLFFKLNYWRHWWDGTLLDDPPADLSITALGYAFFDASFALQRLRLFFSPSPVPANYLLLYWPSGSFSLGRRYPSTPIVNGAGYLDAGGTDATNVAADWITRYGAIPSSGRIFISFKFVNRSNGASTPLLTYTEAIT